MLCANKYYLLHWDWISLFEFVCVCGFFSFSIRSHSHTSIWLYDHNISLCMNVYLCRGFLHYMIQYHVHGFQLGTYKLISSHEYTHSFSNIRLHTYMYSQTERHRHHTFTLHHWQQQKYTILNATETIFGLCLCICMYVWVYPSVTKPLWMWMCMYSIWNSELNEMRDTITVAEILPNWNDHDAIILSYCVAQWFNKMESMKID